MPGKCLHIPYVYPNENDTNLFHIYRIVLSKDLNWHLINLFGDKELGIPNKKNVKQDLVDVSYCEH